MPTFSGQTVTVKNWCSTQLPDGTHDKCDPCYHPVSYIYVAHGVPTIYSLNGRHSGQITTAFDVRPTDPGYTPPTAPPVKAYYGDGSLLKEYSGIQGLVIAFTIDGVASQNFPTSTTWDVHWSYAGYYTGEPDGLLYLNADALRAAEQFPQVISGEVSLLYGDNESNPDWIVGNTFTYSYILAVPA